jgi:hypothetical protein
VTVGALLAATHREQAEYLRRVFLTSPANRDRIDALLALPELYRNLVLLEIAELSPGIVVRALETVEGIGCLGCAHARHMVGSCLVAGIDDEGRETYCLCGAPGPGPQVAVISEEDHARQQELADAAWEHYQDEQAQRAAEAEL